MVKHGDKKNATKKIKPLLVPGIDTYFKELGEEPINEWFKKEYRMESLPEKLRDEKFLIEVSKLDKKFQKYLFNLKSSGVPKGSKRKNNPISSDYGICNGPICEGKESLTIEFVNNYCRNCDLYVSKFSIHRIFNHITGHSLTRRKINSHNKDFELVDQVSNFIRLEVFYKLWEGKYRCAITGIDLDDFTGLFNPNRPKNLQEIVTGDERWLNHWSIDRIDHRKGYVFDNIQIVSRKCNSIKGTLEPHFSSWKLENTSQLKMIFKKLLKQLEMIYD